MRQRALLLLHAESLAEHGGRAGVLSAAGLESALARPRQIFNYEKKAGFARLAAAYAAGLVRNHPFADGNKRAAFLAAGLFLELNGFRLTAGQADAAANMLALTAGELSEIDFAAWVRTHMKRG